MITTSQLRHVLTRPGYELVDASSVPSPESCGREPSQTELLFEQEYLEWRLEAGLIVFWLREPEIRMPGQTYTPDYLELTTGGRINIYEVKGSFTLGSESRSSVKIRWTAALFGNEAINFSWARRLDSGKWRMRPVKTTREKAR